MSPTVCPQLSSKKWTLCWHQVKFRVCSKAKNTCFYSVSTSKTTPKAWPPMIKSTKASSKTCKEISTLSSQWTPITQTSQTEPHLLLPCSTGVLSIGLEIGQRKAFYRLLKSSLLLLTLLFNLLRLPLRKMSKDIMLLLILLLEFIALWLNWIRNLPNQLRSSTTSHQETSLISSSTLLSCLTRRNLCLRINSSIWMSVLIN